MTQQCSIGTTTRALLRTLAASCAVAAAVHAAPEMFALRSLGDEVLSHGPGGGFSGLQEHLGDDYIAAWQVPGIKDAAVVNSGVSRWHNFYIEGLDWLVKHEHIDGLYLDDVAFDRLTIKRVRKTLDRSNPRALLDLHSANQYNPRDGYASSQTCISNTFRISTDFGLVSISTTTPGPTTGWWRFLEFRSA